MHAEGTPRPRNLGTDVAVRSKGPATGKTPAKKPTSRKTTPTAKASSKTSKAKASGKKAPAGKSSAPPSRACDVQSEKRGRGRGRPKDTPDVWTDGHIAEVADQLWNFIETTPCPIEADFCLKYLVSHQRLSDIPELRKLRDYLNAKKASYYHGRGIGLRSGEGALGSFIAKGIANCGPYSLVDKAEITNHNDNASRAAEMTPAERAEYLKERGWTRK